MCIEDISDYDAMIHVCDYMVPDWIRDEWNRNNIDYKLKDRRWLYQLCLEYSWGWWEEKHKEKFNCGICDEEDDDEDWFW